MALSRKKGATKHCAFGTCTSDSRYPDRPSMKDVFFIRFPQINKDPEKCVKWSKACSRQNFTEKNVKKDTYICSLHFVGGHGPTADFPDPIPATATKYDVVRLTKKPRIPARRRLTLTPVHPTDHNNGSQTFKDKEEVANILLSLHNSVPMTKETSKKQEYDGHKNKENICDADLQEQESRKRPCYDDISNGSQLMTKKAVVTDGQTQTSSYLTLNLKESLALKLENYQLKRKLDDMADACDTKREFRLENVQNDDNQMKFYTGLSFAQFLCLWNFLGSAASYHG